MMNKKYVFFVLFIAITGKADFFKMDWEYKKSITISDIEGVAGVKVDAEVYNNAKPDLSDIRVVREDGREIPYKLKVLESREETVCFDPKLYNIARKPYEYTEFYLDVGEENQIINKLHIITPDKNFRRRVEIWGSVNGINWLKIKDDAHIFSFYTEDYEASLTDIKFPDSKRRFYKIVIWDREGRPLKINGCLVYDEKIFTVPLDDIPFKIQSRKENRDKKRTEVILDVIYKNIPKKEIILKLAPPRYHRGVWVFGSDDVEDWQRLNTAVIYRYNKDNRNNVISLPQIRNRYIKLTIYNQDDPPLKIENISIKGDRQFIYFPVEKYEKYYLFYGRSDARKPVYEFEKLLPFMESEKIILLGLDKEEINEDFSRIKEEIEEEAFYILPMVAFVVLLLGFLIIKSFMRINEKRQKRKAKQKKREEERAKRTKKKYKYPKKW